MVAVGRRKVPIGVGCGGGFIGGRWYREKVVRRGLVVLGVWGRLERVAVLAAGVKCGV